MSRQEKFRTAFTSFENAYPLITSLHASLFSSEIKRFQQEFPRLHFKKVKDFVYNGQNLYAVVVSHKYR